MTTITINGNKFDPQAASRTLGIDRPDASDSNFILIQTSGRLSKDNKTELSSLEVGVKEYVSENTYLCRYEPADLGRIRDLPYVEWANIYSPELAISRGLRSGSPPTAESVGAVNSDQAPLRPVIESSDAQTVDIIFHTGRGTEDVKTVIAEAAHVDAGSISGTPGQGKVRLTLLPRYLQAVAAIDDVRSIERVHAKKLFNNVARGIINAEVDIGSVSYKGKGQVVAVADTGVDSGHPAFQGRIQRTYALGRQEKTDDPAGHGTHVCGSVLGSGTFSDGTVIQGTAPEATLVMQSLVGDDNRSLSGIPDDLSQLFSLTYDNDGARVYNNSWGSSEPGLPYEPEGREIDQFIYDGHQDMVICFAAGNDGADLNQDGVIDLASIGSEAAAKNIITVGASESRRPELTLKYGVQSDGHVDRRFSRAPMRDDSFTNNPDGLAAFSSRGPTREKRLKPDIVAPGTGILSARSSLADDRELFGVSMDPKWMFNAGTSMASPLVAGCCAVLRQTLIENPSDSISSDWSPSAALIKALLINGAVELKGQYVPSEAGPSPNFNSGWGRVDLKNSVVIPGQIEAAGFLEGEVEDGGIHEIKLPVPSGRSLKITLVWTDPPGPELQNDLDLIVKSGSEERHGNMGSGDGYDRSNNVEQIKWPNMSGEATVQIKPFALTTDQQTFAVAWKIT